MGWCVGVIVTEMYHPDSLSRKDMCPAAGQMMGRETPVGRVKLSCRVWPVHWRAHPLQITCVWWWAKVWKHKDPVTWATKGTGYLKLWLASGITDQLPSKYKVLRGGVVEKDKTPGNLFSKTSFDAKIWGKACQMDPCKKQIKYEYRQMGFPGSTHGKVLACQCRRHKRWGFDPWVEKIPWGGQSNPLQHSCLENPMNRGDWLITVHRVTKSRTWLKWLSMHSHTGRCRCFLRKVPKHGDPKRPWCNGWGSSGRPSGNVRLWIVWLASCQPLVSVKDCLWEGAQFLSSSIIGLWSQTWLPRLLPDFSFPPDPYRRFCGLCLASHHQTHFCHTKNMYGILGQSE